MTADNLPLPSKPVIAAPVSQHLRVADPARSVAFYRDILGFSVHDVVADFGLSAVAEVAYGPARVQFGIRTPDTSDHHRVLFFETDQVEALRHAIVEHGGMPSGLEEVNWIKMRVFEIRDPDGHTLWFGQPYGEPDATRAAHQLRTIMPELPLDDVPAGVAYYRDVLGFEVNYQQHDLGVMDRDEVRLLLIARTPRHTGIGSCSLYVAAVDALYAELADKGANVQGAPISHPWGLREFQVLDPEGNRISFAQTFE
jgi:catechol 2,3-dioxygenase-like lactoylglutathione lyase family enzyme